MTEGTANIYSNGLMGKFNGRSLQMAAHNAVLKAHFSLLFGDETTQTAGLVLQVVRTELN